VVQCAIPRPSAIAVIWTDLKLAFSRCIGIDYSGAQHARAGLPGLRIFEAHASAPTAIEIRPDPSVSERHWSRSEIAQWLVENITGVEAQGCEPLLIGIDHALSFPRAYFEKYKLAENWDTFLNDFCVHWPSLNSKMSVRDILLTQKAELDFEKTRLGESRWRRLCEKHSRGAKSVFHFGVPGSVASSTHAGLVWIHFLRNHQRLKNLVHFWPYDGWIPEPGKSVIAEIYPALWNKQSERGALTQDQHDARVVAIGLYEAVKNGNLLRWFQPEDWQKISLSPFEVEYARIEGWILGLC
jgi:hypothetical protein